MSESQNLDQIVSNAEDLKNQAEAVLSQTLAPKPAPVSPPRDHAADDPAEVAADQAARDAINAPTLANTEEKKDAIIAPVIISRDDQPDGQAGGGYPPARTGGRNFLPDENQGGAGTDHPKKISDKNLEVSAITDDNDSPQPNPNKGGYIPTTARTAHLRLGRPRLKPPITNPAAELPHKKKKVRVAPSDIVRFIPHVRSKKMRDLFTLLLENKDLDLIEAMNKLGYAPKIPASRITNSQGWQYMINYYFNRDELMEVERGLLEHPDWRARNSSLDRLHKIMGSFNRAIDININPGGGVRQLSDQQLFDIIEGEIVENPPPATT